MQLPYGFLLVSEAKVDGSAPYRGAIASARPARAAAVPLAGKAFTPVPPQHDLGVYDRLLEVAV